MAVLTQLPVPFRASTLTGQTDRKQLCQLILNDIFAHSTRRRRSGCHLLPWLDKRLIDWSSALPRSVARQKYTVHSLMHTHARKERDGRDAKSTHTVGRHQQQKDRRSSLLVHNQRFPRVSNVPKRALLSHFVDVTAHSWCSLSRPLVDYARAFAGSVERMATRPYTHTHSIHAATRWKLCFWTVTGDRHVEKVNGMCVFGKSCQHTLHKKTSHTRVSFITVDDHMDIPLSTSIERYLTNCFSDISIVYGAYSGVESKSLTHARVFSSCW